MRYYNDKKRSLRKKIIMATILGVLIPLLIFGVIFFTSTYTTFGNYLSSDMNFFLKQVNNNLGNRTELIEDMLLDIRDNEIIYNYLDSKYQSKPTTISEAMVVKNLAKCIDIYSSKNSKELDKPFVHNVYLFDSKGKFTRTLYDDLIQLDEANLDLKYQMLYNQFVKDGKDVQFFKAIDKYIIAYTVFSKFMDNLGTIFFEINIDSINQVMSEIDKYNNSFWFVYDKYGNIISQSKDINLDKATVAEIMESELNVYYRVVRGESYLMHSDTLSMGIRVVSAIPKDILMTLLIKATLAPIIISILCSVVIIIIVSFVAYNMTKPLKEVMDKLEIVGKGDFNTKLPEYDNIEFANISKAFNIMTDEIRFLVNDVYKKQLMVKEMDLKFLQSQMNPHFMFNVLNTISFKAQMEGNEEIYKMISSFAQLLQATIYRKDNEKIKLKEEIKYVNYYLYLQSYRFQEKLNYTIKYIDESLLEYYIPKLTIQLIVENAVVHGIEKKVDEGMVKVKIYSSDSGVKIEVKDDGYGFDEIEGIIKPPFDFMEATATHNRVGLNNAQGIIQYFYGEPYGITIDTAKGIGTKVIVHIPFDKGE